ncbi:Membrane fusion component of tripartite multidrug resistance system [Collimonas arenae]|uniref:Membrane fusion component of tripartite multidrug resistance system n=1 Tax=Collimonas arenae TaxID=279058 RepID=A0A0A1FBN4_9BURK|nr:HlyD family efflux transporter periplasmic adaptor subunit [Collimonas arenae]AIY42153.1 Membrane fusion component of tripartite multidrug resistance system [Collimonas arenae]
MTTEPEINRLRNKRTLALMAISVLFVVGVIAYSLYYFLVLSQREETDNAYVGGNQVTLAAQVTGNVQQIGADETQLVQAGAQVVTLDPTDAQLNLQQAEARLGNIVRQQREHYADVAQYDALVSQRQLAVTRAADDLARRLPLATDHTLSGEDVDHARQTLADAKAAAEVAARQAEAARAATAGVVIAKNPAILAAKADFSEAWLAVRRNAILAPVSGYVAKRSVQVGARITPGMALMSIVPLDQLWVDANFKESELKNIRLGQAATIEADIYGGKVTYHGKVVGLSAGTGSAFSLLPAQNANGNWIKVVQRLPVRIALNPDELKAHPLRIGLSTTVTVDTHNRNGVILGEAMPGQPVYSTLALHQPMQEADALADKIVAQNLIR